LVVSDADTDVVESPTTSSVDWTTPGRYDTQVKLQVGTAVHNITHSGLKLAFHNADTDTDSDSPDTSIHPFVRYARFPREEVRVGVGVRVGVVECQLNYKFSHPLQRLQNMVIAPPPLSAIELDECRSLIESNVNGSSVILTAVFDGGGGGTRASDLCGPPYVAWSAGVVVTRLICHRCKNSHAIWDHTELTCHPAEVTSPPLSDSVIPRDARLS